MDISKPCPKVTVQLRLTHEAKSEITKQANSKFKGEGQATLNQLPMFNDKFSV